MPRPQGTRPVRRRHGQRRHGRGKGRHEYDYAQDRLDNGPLPPPEAGTDGRFFWIRQSFHAEKTFPGGFEVSAAHVGTEVRRVRIKSRSAPRGNRVSFVDGTSVVTDGRWHPVRAVRDAASAELKILADGKLEATSPEFTAGGFCAAAPITIGAYLWGSHTRFARGLVDDVQITGLGRMIEAKLPKR